MRSPRAGSTLVGCGGVAPAPTCSRKLRAGASFVQLYTAFAYEGPALIARLKRELLAAMREQGFQSVSEADRDRGVNSSTGFAEIAGEYDGFILDLWGVIHDGVNPIPGAPECLLRLHAGRQARRRCSRTPRAAPPSSPTNSARWASRTTTTPA